MEKTMRFDMLENFGQFRFPAGPAAAGRPAAIGQGLFVKVSARKAAPAVENSGPAMLSAFAVKPSETVVVTVPDPVPPTAEELAAQRVKRFNLRVDRFIADGDSAQADVIKALQDGSSLHEVVRWKGDNALMYSTRRDVALAMREIAQADTGGIDKALAAARERALRGARWPHNSTSPLSNLVERDLNAAYAEFVHGFDE